MEAQHRKVVTWILRFPWLLFIERSHWPLGLWSAPHSSFPRKRCRSKTRIYQRAPRVEKHFIPTMNTKYNLSVNLNQFKFNSCWSKSKSVMFIVASISLVISELLMWLILSVMGSLLISKAAPNWAVMRDLEDGLSPSNKTVVTPEILGRYYNKSSGLLSL